MHALSQVTPMQLVRVSVNTQAIHSTRAIIACLQAPCGCARETRGCTRCWSPAPAPSTAAERATQAGTSAWHRAALDGTYPWDSVTARDAVPPCAAAWGDGHSPAGGGAVWGGGSLLAGGVTSLRPKGDPEDGRLASRHLHSQS